MGYFDIEIKKEDGEEGSVQFICAFNDGAPHTAECVRTFMFGSLLPYDPDAKGSGGTSVFHISMASLYQSVLTATTPSLYSHITQCSNLIASFKDFFSVFDAQVISFLWGIKI